jgi:hypothetical protein
MKEVRRETCRIVNPPSSVEPQPTTQGVFGSFQLGGDGGPGNADDLVDMIWETTRNPVRSPGGRGMRKSGASTQSDVIGQIVTLWCVGLNRSDCTTSAGRGLPV